MAPDIPSGWTLCASSFNWAPVRVMVVSSFAKGWIDAAQLRKQGEALAKNDYGRYLLRLADEGRAP